MSPGDPFHRGELYSAVLPGDLGKPRPVLIIQSDLFSEHPTVTVLPLTSHLRDAPLIRYRLNAGEYGLDRNSQVMIDKIMTIRRDKLGQRIGKLPPHKMKEIEQLMLVFLGVAD